MTCIPDVDRLILQELDDNELFHICIPAKNKYLLKICDDFFYKNRLFIKSKNIALMKPTNISWKKYYIGLVTSIKKLLDNLKISYSKVCIWSKYFEEIRKPYYVYKPNSLKISCKTESYFKDTNRSNFIYDFLETLEVSDQNLNELGRIIDLSYKFKIVTSIYLMLKAQIIYNDGNTDYIKYLRNIIEDFVPYEYVFKKDKLYLEHQIVKKKFINSEHNLNNKFSI